METVKRIRTMRGMNQVDLAKASGVAQNTISEIELGKREARPATLKKLADALGVEIVDLFEEAHPLAQAPPEPQAQERREPEVHTGKAKLKGEGTLHAEPFLLIGREGLARLLGRTERGEISAEEAMGEVLEEAEIRQ